ncbi:long-chain fatty acid--CoA ligase [Saprospiraceae bacterium]|jgi:long-chain acyl-CoA synthetase|nr:long-chain fatty acid--CoA ligase [Saprospiraceae bacterium]MDG1433795.1 long-chain fatty acid--CoA ligase [Saprospiraceae bacterium]
MLNLACILEDSARRYPTSPAFTFGETTLNYAQINGAANQIANGLKSKGIKRGDKVAIDCLNLPYFPMIYFGILKAGATVVPLSVLLKKDEIAYHLRDSEAKAFFCFVGTPDLPMGEMGYGGFKEVDTCEQFYMITAKPTDPSPIAGTQTLGSLMAGQSPVFNKMASDPNDTAVIIYTSGTTGKPKGAMLSHSNIMLNTVISADLADVNNKDVQIIVLPLFHIFAMTVLMNSGVYKGAHNILLPRFDGDAVFGLLEKHDVTIFAGVPTMYWGMVNFDSSKYDTDKISRNLRACFSGGASLPVQVLKDFEEKFNVPIMEGFGMSEGSPVVTFNHKNDVRKPGSIGKPVWGVEVKLVNDNGDEVAIGEKGELVYRGHNVMKGYYNKPEATAATIRNGWLHSGDVATKDEDGYYYIVDRTKDMIIRGGLNVYPREVEDVMMKHEGVSMVAVIGVPDEKFGENIKAFVIMKEGETSTEDEMKAWTKERIADYKYPRHIEFVATLPMSATGKILKKELRVR